MPFLGLACLDVFDGIADGCDPFSGFVGDFDVEGFFQCHHEFHGVQGVGPKIVLEVGFRLDFAGINAELLSNDRADFLEDRFLGHSRGNGTLHLTGRAQAAGH